MANDTGEVIRAEAPTGELEELVIQDVYTDWQKSEGVRVIVDYAFDDLRKTELTPWPRKGGSGAIINIPGEVLYNDSHLVEIKPGGQSEPEHHMYEENVYILSGYGTTRIWLEGEEPSTFEWHAGSLFSIPLNAWYQHFNGSSQEPARYLAVTEAPPAMRHFRDLDYIFNCPFKFKSRYDGHEEYFSKGRLLKKRVWETNFVPNARDMGLHAWASRGAGGVNTMLELAKNSQKAHISEFPIGTYKKAHRHGPGAHLLILSGIGFSLLWTKSDMSDLRQANWSEGGMVIVPDDACFHQHFNAGTTRARYLAFRPSKQGTVTPYRPGELAEMSINEGGWQVEYEDQYPIVQEIFERELAKNGGESRMEQYLSEARAKKRA